MSRVQFVAISQPEVPQEPISSGMPAFSRASIMTSRSRFTASREYLLTPRARYDGPLSVEPASAAIATAPAAMPLATCSARIPPVPNAPVGTITFTLSRDDRTAMRRSLLIRAVLLRSGLRLVKPDAGDCRCGHENSIHGVWTTGD